MKISHRIFKMAGIFIAMALIAAAIGSAAYAQEVDSSTEETGRMIPPRGESISGWLAIIWGDDPSGGTQTIYTLTDQSGRTIPLTLDDKLDPGALRSLNGKFITLEGDWGDSSSFNVAFASADPAVKGLTSDAIEPAVSGSKPWISIMCKFNDFADEPHNLSYFQNMYSSSSPGLDHYWRELSYNIANVSGSNASGWFILPYGREHYNPGYVSQGADLDKLATDCIAAADASVNFAAYEGINMMFNVDFDNGWAWGGSRVMTLDGQVNHLWSTTWEPPWAYADISVIAHEMGHGFGLPHSSGMYGATYDNAWDVMSQDRFNCAAATDPTYGCKAQHTISYHKNLLGWIAPGLIYTPTASATPMTLHMDRLAGPTYPTDYRMAILPITPGSTTHFYTVEVRRQWGYDSKIEGDAVIIHEVLTSRGIPAQIIDPDLNNDTSDAGAMWTVGETFTDAAHGISVQINATSVSGFWMDITYNPPPTTDDAYEENDTLGAAYDLSYWEQTWLSDISGYGKQFDEDWYKIDVTPGYERVQVYATFTDSLGDIDIALYDSLGNLVTGSYGVSDNESIDYVVPASGIYYIKVYYGNQGNEYNLWWDDGIINQVTYKSTAIQDGWILESSESSTSGGTMNSSALTISIGDASYDKQYRGILSFNTASLPEGAKVVSAIVKVRKSTVVGTNPFSTHGKLYCDLKRGSFGTASLALTDFNASPSVSAAGTFLSIANSWYSATLTNSALTYINTAGLTQCRLRFSKDDNDDNSADILNLHSGSATTSSNRPVLIVKYYTP